jgi:ornithine carbamoyltransferase
MKRDLISFALWSGEELVGMLELAGRLKGKASGGFRPMSHKSAALIFERKSLRTRVSFEVGIAQLGGHPIVLQQETIGLATRESVHDVGQVLSQYNALIVARTARHQTCVQLAESASVPVINAMTDLVHPCQILADLFTLQEQKRFSPSVGIVFIGDGNNVANTWLECAEKIPLNLTLCCPPGYEPHPQMLEQAQLAGRSSIRVIPDPEEAIRNADVLYTDVWPQQEDLRRDRAFHAYQVNAQLLKRARPDCLVMHRLPAHRGEEITSEVLDGKQSVALLQAENRLHIQKAIMASLLGASLD